MENDNAVVGHLVTDDTPHLLDAVPYYLIKPLLTFNFSLLMTYTDLIND
jgi:hypothetical protein